MGIKAWLRNWLLDEHRDEALYRNDIKIDDDSEHFDHHNNTIRFTVSTARGGCIMSVRHYDRLKDENHNTVHVIHDNDDIAQNIAHIVSMELLRKA